MINLKNKKGAGLIEIVVGLSIISVSFFSVVTAYNFFIRVAVKNADVTKINYLLEEEVEVVRSLRDASWINFFGLATSTNYSIIFEEGLWKATTTNIYIDNRFERYFILNDVYRDAGGDIAVSGTLDNGTRKVSAFVSTFVAGATSTQTVDFYLTNLFE